MASHFGTVRVVGVHCLGIVIAVGVVENSVVCHIAVVSKPLKAASKAAGSGRQNRNTQL